MRRVGGRRRPVIGTTCAEPVARGVGAGGAWPRYRRGPIHDTSGRTVRSRMWVARTVRGDGRAGGNGLPQDRDPGVLPVDTVSAQPDVVRVEPGKSCGSGVLSRRVGADSPAFPVVGNHVVPITTGKRRSSWREELFEGTCTIRSNIGEKSTTMADVTVDRSAEDCDVADRVMRLVEPRLP